MPYRGGPVDEALELAYRTDRGRVLACLIGIVKDFDLAEDALQDAFAAAAETWPRRGIPSNPAGWLVTTARRKMIDRLRRAAAAQRRHRVWGELSIAWDTGEHTGPIADDRLRLIFTCCHPALSLEARVALTLRSLGGLTTEEVARAFLVSEPALAQRIVRAKRKIGQAGIAYRVPSPEELPDRLDSVLTVIYLIFNAGYLVGSGTELVRVDLCDEAIRLAGLVVDLLPVEPEPLGLAALLHFQDSRRSARIDRDGRPLTLEEQDRGQWDADKANAGFALLDRAQRMNAVGPHQLKAAIGALHTGAPRANLTDWATIVALYDRLLAWEPTPIVRLNRAVALAMADGPDAGLAILDGADLAAELDGYHLFHSTRADLLRRSGRLDEAAIAYRLARHLTDNTVEQSFLGRRLDELAGAGEPPTRPGIHP